MPFSPYGWSNSRQRCLAANTLKYRLAYVVDGVCVLRFDNEAGKGDHIHRNGKEAPYSFASLEKLLADFWTAVDNWRP